MRLHARQTVIPFDVTRPQESIDLDSLLGVEVEVMNDSKRVSLKLGYSTFAVTHASIDSCTLLYHSQALGRVYLTLSCNVRTVEGDNASLRIMTKIIAPQLLPGAYIQRQRVSLLPVQVSLSAANRRGV